MGQGLRNYLVVTGGYWAFTVTDGAIRMLVVLYFHQLGYSPFEVAMLFLFYEFFGIVTNLVGGWLGARIGLNLTMHIGMGMQVVALAALTVPDAWLSVPWVMAAQALSGIAKDLNKMSAKASVKTMAGSGGESKLFRWVAILTGSKNALKGAGFFVGAALLEWIGFRGALAVLAGLLFVLHLVRLLGWHNAGIWHKPLLWILYLAYAAMVAGFALKTGVYLFGLSPFLALHAFAVGGIGLMTLGMMTRVALGHTGRDVFDPPPVLKLVFALLLAAALVRVVLPLLAEAHYVVWVGLSQWLWIGAFLVYFLVYFPILTRPRIDGQDG